MDKIIRLKNNFKRELIYQNNNERYYLDWKRARYNYNFFIFSCEYYVDGVFSYYYEGLNTRPFVIVFEINKSKYVYLKFFNNFDSAEDYLEKIRYKIINNFKIMDIE